MMRKGIIAVLFFCIAFSGNAQDIHFSQYFFNPLQINPGLTGIMDGRYRASISYRDQWSSLLGQSSFKTIKASFDYKIPFRKNDFIALGVNLVGDEAGINKYRQTIGNFSVAYHKKLIDNKYTKNTQFITAGLKAGAGQNSLGWADLWFGRQYDVGAEVVDTSLPSGENLAELSSDTYTDFGVGIMWYAVIKDKSIYVGAAMDHLAEPNISLIGSQENLSQKITVNVGGTIGLNEYSMLMPSILYLRQAGYRQINAGSQIRYSRNDWDEVALRFGMFGRYARTVDASHIDALIFTTAIEMNRIIMGLSYDFTVSTLQSFNSRKGAFEFTLIYKNPTITRREKINCPKF